MDTTKITNALENAGRKLRRYVSHLRVKARGFEIDDKPARAEKLSARAEEVEAVLVEVYEALEMLEEESDRSFELFSDLMANRISRAEAEECGLLTRTIRTELLEDPATANVIDVETENFLVYVSYEWGLVSRMNDGGYYAYTPDELKDFDDDGHQTVETAISEYLRELNQ